MIVTNHIAYRIEVNNLLDHTKVDKNIIRCILKY